MTWANRLAFVLVCATVVFSTLAYGTVHQPVIAVFYAVTAMLAVLWALDGVIGGSVRFSRSLLQIPLLAAAVYGLIQVIPFGSIGQIAGVPDIPRTISLDPFATQVSALHFFALFLFFAVTWWLLDSAARLRRLANVIIIFGFCYAFFAILQSVLSPDKIYGIYETRFAVPFGSFVSRHNFAAFMEMTLAIPLGLVFVGAIRPDKRLLYFTAIGLMGVALLLSGSRGGFVALVAEIILVILLTTGQEGRRKTVLKIALSLALLTAVVGGAVYVGGETSLTRIAETASTDDVTTGRSHIWHVASEMIAANFPFGAGLGAFGVAYTPFDNLSGLERVEQAHNDYLQVLTDAGLVGLVIGAFFLVVLIREGIGTPRIENTYRRGLAVGAFAGSCAILVHSIFDFVLHTTAIAVLFLVLISILTASRNSFKDDVEEFSIRPAKKRKAGSVASISRVGRRATSGGMLRTAKQEFQPGVCAAN
ncbi:MAG TPA: O-antigen ligase family protein, partial [Pyrinomonadaceae bacterium]|nr:O-antigen ligase family protein [Pyrinomonadaceae bacterium]